jgi:DNA processing protein
LGPANRIFTKLLDRFGSPYEIFEADEGVIDSLEGLTPRMRAALLNKELDSSYRILSFCEENDVGILKYSDERYPSKLKMLQDPPVLLYFKGRLPSLTSNVFIGVVGTRKMSEYGMKMAYKISYELASCGAVIVSGMALGIDSVAACAAIEAKGRTIAVLGCGIDITYPAQHARLKGIIENNGVVMTEFPPATPPEGRNFPIRNRIISGLSQGTLVVEADLGSGALITAKDAILQGRDVYAVPGNLDGKNTGGTNKLIHDGAQLVLETGDILRNYEDVYAHVLFPENLSRAKRHSDLNVDALERMGVAVRLYDSRDRREIEREFKNEQSRRPISDNIAPKAEEKKASPKKAGKEKQREEKEEIKKRDGDDSIAVLATLSETHRRIFEEMPIDHSVPIDFFTKLGYSMGEIMSTLTILEIKGLIQSMPGGLYAKI